MLPAASPGESEVAGCGGLLGLRASPRLDGTVCGRRGRALTAPSPRQAARAGKRSVAPCAAPAQSPAAGEGSEGGGIKSVGAAARSNANVTGDPTATTPALELLVERRNDGACIIHASLTTARSTLLGNADDPHEGRTAGTRAWCGEEPTGPKAGNGGTYARWWKHSGAAEGRIPVAGTMPEHAAPSEKPPDGKQAPCRRGPCNRRRRAMDLPM